MTAVRGGEDERAVPAFSWEHWYASVGGRNINIPEVEEYLRRIYEEQMPRFATAAREGEPEDFGSPEAAATEIKRVATELGADAVGICKVEVSDLYRGRTVEHDYAVMIAKRMRYREFAEVPSKASAIECVRIYHELGELCLALAQNLRERGHAARVEHPVGDADVLHVPLALKAGLGELGRHGSIIHPELGPLFRLGGVLVSLPVKTDAPIDAGIAAFCDRCRACRIYCPADAVPDERSETGGVDHLGNRRYLVDTGRCFPYFAKHHYCSACLPVCVYEHKKWARDFDGHATPKFPAVEMHDPPAAVDAVPESRRHRYPRKDRSQVIPASHLRRGSRAGSAVDD